MKHEKMIADTYLLFFSYYQQCRLFIGVDVISFGCCLFSLTDNFFIVVGHTTKHMMHDVHCASFEYDMSLS